jgi:hypothetical protein
MPGNEMDVAAQRLLQQPEEAMPGTLGWQRLHRRSEIPS